MDFNHYSAEYRDNAPEILRDLRARCPVSRSSAHGGFWVVTSCDAVSEAARDAVTLSSCKDVPAGAGPLRGATLPDSHPDTRQGFAEMDGEMHLAIQQLLAPFFLRGRQDAPRGRALRELVHRSVHRTGRSGFVNEPAGPVPSMLTMRMLGLPLEDWRSYADAAHKPFYPVAGTPEYEALAGTRQWLHGQLQEAGEDGDHQ